MSFHKMKFCSREGMWPRSQVRFSFSLYLGHLQPRHIPSHPFAHVSVFREMTILSGLTSDYPDEERDFIFLQDFI